MMERWQKNLAELATGAAIIQRRDRYEKMLVWHRQSHINIPHAAALSEGYGFPDYPDGSATITCPCGLQLTEPFAVFPSEELFARVALSVRNNPQVTIFNYDLTDEVVLRRPDGSTKRITR